MKQYFDFLRFSLETNAPLPQNLERMDWRGLFRFAKEQALLGVMFQGIKKLPQGTLTDFALLSKWLMLANKIALNNERINQVAVRLTQKLNADGWNCCILKGQGNNLYYPDPFSRMPGDIDVWITKGEHPFLPTKEHRKRVVEYLKRTFQAAHTQIHHTEFPYEQVEVEAHFFPGMLNSPWHNHRLQRWFDEQALRQSGHKVQLPKEAGFIPVPTLDFNLLYQMYHLFHHFFDEGIGLRQMVDYYELLLAMEPGKTAVCDKDFGRFGLRRFAGAVMWVLGETLGLDRDRMIVAPDERRGKVLLEEILNGGNFGKYDKKYGGIAYKSRAGKLFTKIKRSLSFARLYPSEALSVPFFRIWHFGWKLCNRKFLN